MVPDEQHGQVPRTGGDKGQRSGLEDPPKCGGCAWWAGGVRLLGETTLSSPSRLLSSSSHAATVHHDVCRPHTYSERQSVQLALLHSGPSAEAVLAVCLLNEQLTKEETWCVLP